MQYSKKFLVSNVDSQFANVEEKQAQPMSVQGAVAVWGSLLPHSSI